MSKENVEIKSISKKQRRFICGDIHGAHKALVQVLDRCGFDYENDLLITIGDIVDGWKDSYLVVEELLKIPNRIDIVGNHDDWFIEFLNTTTHGDKWEQGGLATAKSYADAMGIELKVHTTAYTDFNGSKKWFHTTNLIPDDIPESHQQFFKRQARYYRDDSNNIFVHGGFWRAFPVNETPRDRMMWDRKLWKQSLSAERTKSKLKFFEDDINQVFVGHTSTMSWDLMEPMKADRVWNVDTGAGGDGKLTIMDVDTNEFWQSDLVYELYHDDDHKYNVKKFK